jgi:hypothetical protein
MAQKDWFRRSTWTLGDSEAFFARLARSRTTFHKAQYVAIQASTLLSTGRSNLVAHALELSTLGVRQYPEPAFLAGLHLTRAHCLIALGRDADAILAFRAAFHATRAYPGMKTGAELDFAWWVATAGLRQLFDEALNAMNEFDAKSNAIWPAHAYRFVGALALISDAMGEREQASRWATDAIAAAEREKSPFRFHRKLGLVKSPPERAHRRLLDLAAT